MTWHDVSCDILTEWCLHSYRLFSYSQRYQAEKVWAENLLRSTYAAGSHHPRGIYSRSAKPSGDLSSQRSHPLYWELWNIFHSAGFKSAKWSFVTQSVVDVRWTKVELTMLKGDMWCSVGHNHQLKLWNTYLMAFGAVRCRLFYSLGSFVSDSELFELVI